MDDQTQQPTNSESPPQAVDWLAFCDAESTRYALDVPWIKDGWKFATNWRVIIAVPTGESDSPPDAKGRRFANALPLLSPVIGRNESIQWLPLPKFEPCDKCKNKGTITQPCSTCKGSLQAKCDMGHYHDCTDCKKTGKESCPCDCFVMVESRMLHTEFFEKVLKLPGLAGYYVPNSDPEDRVFFCFGELRNCFAIIMPLAPDATGFDDDRIERKAVLTP